MNRLINKLAVVTGSASGIGKAITKELLNTKVTVIGLDKNYESLKKLQSELPTNQKDSFEPFHCDIRKLEVVQETFSKISKSHGTPNFLINSAGLLHHGNLVQMPLHEVQNTLSTLLMGCINCTRTAYQEMKEKEIDGHIIFVNSINGHRIPVYLGKNVPTTNIYTPSKYAITAMTEVLRQELLNIESNIKVTSISPGLTETSLVPEFLLENPNIQRLQPKDIADCVLFALNTPTHVQIHEMIVLPLRGIF